MKWTCRSRRRRRALASLRSRCLARSPVYPVADVRQLSVRPLRERRPRRALRRGTGRPAIFRGKGNCTACHVGPNFTDERFHNTEVAWSARSDRSADSFTDEGRGVISGKPEDRGAFKTPTLREVARTSPYMHDGSIASLEEIVDYYDRGGNRNPTLNAELRPLGLSGVQRLPSFPFCGRFLAGHHLTSAAGRPRTIRETCAVGG